FGTIANNGLVRVDYQSDGNLVVYNNLSGTSLWSAGTQGNPEGKLCFQSDGNFVAYDSSGAPKWDAFHNASNKGNNVVLVLQNDCNLVLTNQDSGLPIWASGTNPCPD
ncbi:hypothetical protein LCGC14_3121140, partial [marine sediment metagenome]